MGVLKQDLPGSPFNRSFNETLLARSILSVLEAARPAAIVRRVGGSNVRSF